VTAVLSNTGSDRMSPRTIQLQPQSKSSPRKQQIEDRVADAWLLIKLCQGWKSAPYPPRYMNGDVSQIDSLRGGRDAPWLVARHNAWRRQLPRQGV